MTARRALLLVAAGCVVATALGLVFGQGRTVALAAALALAGALAAATALQLRPAQRQQPAPRARVRALRGMAVCHAPHVLRRSRVGAASGAAGADAWAEGVPAADVA